MRRTTGGGGRPGRGILVDVGTLVRLGTKKKEKEEKNRIDRYMKGMSSRRFCGYVM